MGIDRPQWPTGTCSIWWGRLVSDDMTERVGFTRTHLLWALHMLVHYVHVTVTHIEHSYNTTTYIERATSTHHHYASPSSIPPRYQNCRSKYGEAWIQVSTHGPCWSEGWDIRGVPSICRCWGSKVCFFLLLSWLFNCFITQHVTELASLHMWSIRCSS